MAMDTNAAFVDANVGGLSYLAAVAAASVMGLHYPINVLVVDENDQSLTSVVNLVKSCGYVATMAANASEALALLSQGAGLPAINLVMVDAYLRHDMDVFQFLRIIAFRFNLPVIMMLHNGELIDQFVCKAIEAGACECLLRPIRIEEIKILWQHVIKRTHNAVKSCMEMSTMQMNLEQMPPYVQPLPQPDQNIGRECPAAIQLNPLDGSNGVQSPLFQENIDNIRHSPVLQEKCDVQIKEFRTDANENIDNIRHCPVFQENIDNGEHMRHSPLLQEKCNEQIKELEPPRKKQRVKWTDKPLLQRKFILAVQQLGIDKATPTKILELMKEKDLTRENVSSHLQKYKLRLIKGKEQVLREVIHPVSIPQEAFPSNSAQQLQSTNSQISSTLQPYQSPAWPLVEQLPSIIQSSQQNSPMVDLPMGVEDQQPICENVEFAGGGFDWSDEIDRLLMSQPSNDTEDPMAIVANPLAVADWEKLI